MSLPAEGICGSLCRVRCSSSIVGGLLVLVSHAVNAAPPATPPVGASREAAGFERALETFFQLGLPDARGAKWVAVVSDTMMPGESVLPRSDRHGRADAVRRLLPALLAKTDPAAARDATISLLGDGRLAELTGRWNQTGDAKAFAGGIESRLKHPGVKSALLSSLFRRPPRGAGGDAKPGARPAEVPTDPETRQAILGLLEDSAVVENRGWSIFALKPGARGPFQVQYQVVAIRAPSDENPES